LDKKYKTLPTSIVVVKPIGEVGEGKEKLKY